MNKGIALFGVSSFVLLAMSGSVDAKKIEYEINGQRYSYSTNNRRQVEEARQRIEAANAAAAAEARAKAELAASPLAGIFGSQAQRDASQAQARVPVVSPPEQVTSDTTSSIRTSRAERRRLRQARAGERRRSQATKAAFAGKVAASTIAASKSASGAEPARAAQEATSERRKTVADARAAAKPAEAAAPERAAKPAPTAPEPAGPPAPQKPAIKSVSFDLGSGIKTTAMTDGTVRQEPFDSSTLAKLGSAEPSADSLTSFIDQVRKTPPEPVPSPMPAANVQAKR